MYNETIKINLSWGVLSIKELTYSPDQVEWQNQFLINWNCYNIKLVWNQGCHCPLIPFKESKRYLYAFRKWYFEKYWKIFWRVFEIYIFFEMWLKGLVKFYTFYQIPFNKTPFYGNPVWNYKTVYNTPDLI